MSKKNSGDREQADAHWLFTHMGIEYGPLTDEQLFDVLDRGLLSPSHELRRTDMDETIRAADVEGLFEDAS